MSLIWSVVPHIIMIPLHSQKLACSAQRAGLTLRAERPSESPHIERQALLVCARAILRCARALFTMYLPFLPVQTPWLYRPCLAC